MINFEVIFPNQATDVVKSLRNSEYLKTLFQDPKEQTLKNSYVAHSLGDLTKYYAGSVVPVHPNDQPRVKNTAVKLYRLYNELPVCKIQFVVIDPQSTIEMGSMSFTVNNVVFLSANALTSPQTIAHEMIHVIQRVHSKWFDNVCVKLGFRDVTSALRPFLLSNKYCIGNPDAERIYEDRDGEVVVYSVIDGELRKVVVVTYTGELIPLDSDKTVSVMGMSVPYDSISEMIAVRLASFMNDSTSRKQVNDLLCRIRQ